VIHVLATITLRPGAEEAWFDEFARLAPEVQAEDGCIEYGAAVEVASGIPIQAPVRPGVVMVIEKWSDLGALTAHLEAPHMVAWRERVGDLMTGVSLQILTPA
jgi:quinol monooxygenase YgiN